jgi:orotidine-5'-phosphate decarboxylase
MDERQFSEVYDGSDITGKVLRLASLAQQAGADGVVCSALEASILRNRLNKDFRLVTPGIRPLGSSKDDQTRIMTPAQAMSAGVDYLVIGRPITKALMPALTLAEINASIN